MAKRKNNVPPPPQVICGDCKHFVRDTSGLSRNLYTGEYFMGVSVIGCDPDKTRNSKTGVAKIFADKKRYCKAFDARG